MTYKTHNINDLYIHDTLIDNITFKENSIIFDVTGICVHKDCIDNPHGCDMFVQQAKLTLENVKFKSTQFFGYTDKNINNIVPDLFADTSRIHQDLTKILEYYPEIFSCKKSDDGYTFTILYSSEVVDLSFSFSSFTAEWNSYNDKAWYIKSKGV